jgi:hypothetical protein
MGEIVKQSLRNYKTGRMDKVRMDDDGDGFNYTSYIPQCNLAFGIYHSYMKKCGCSMLEAVTRTICDCLGIPPCEC